MVGSPSDTSDRNNMLETQWGTVPNTILQKFINKQSSQEAKIMPFLDGIV